MLFMLQDSTATDLVTLAELFHSTNGLHWYQHCRWSSSTPTCTSYGITCDDRSERVLQVDLSNCNITGTLPHQWSTMSALHGMYLSDNQLTGSLPHQWSSLSALRDMYLHSNQLNGTLPHQWSAMSALEFMHLFGNQLIGVLPLQWSGMSALQIMSLYGNQLNGTLPHQWSAMSALQSMHLYDNQLTGTLPHQWSRMSALQELHLYSNQLCGTVPNQWQSLPAATLAVSSLDLSNNSLTLSPVAWYVAAPYHSSVYVATLKPAAVCIPPSRSNSQTVAATPSHSLTPLNSSLLAAPTVRPASGVQQRLPSTVTPSLHCDVQLCRIAVPAVNASGTLLHSPPHVPLLPADAGAALMMMRAASVPFAIAHDASVFALRIVCGNYPLPIGVRNAVLLHSGVGLDPRQAAPSAASADEVLLSLPNLTLDSHGWLPVGALPFRDTHTIHINLTISCGGDAAIVITVPVLPEPLPPLSSAVAVVSGAAQWVSAAGSTGAGGSLGRAAASQRLQLCSSVGSSGGGLLGVSIGDVGNLERSLARGAVVGNLAVLASAAAALLCVALLYGVTTGSDFRSSLLRVALPSSLLPVWTATLPTTAAALPLLVDADVGIAALAIAVVVLPMLLLAVPLLACGGALVLVERGILSEQQHERCGVLLSTLVELLSRSRARRWRWRYASEVSATPLLRAAWVVLLDYRVLWYLPLDAAVLTATCVLSVVSGMGDALLCRSAGWAMLALCATQLCVCLAVRPMTSLASNVHCVSCLVLTFAALLVQCVGLSSAESLSPAAAAVAVILQLLVVGLSLVKLLDDLWNVVFSGLRLYSELGHCLTPCTSPNNEPLVSGEGNAVSGTSDCEMNLLDWQPPAGDRDATETATRTSKVSPVAEVVAARLMLCDDDEHDEVTAAAAEVDVHALVGKSVPSRRLMLYEELAQCRGDNTTDLVHYRPCL